MGGSDGNLKKSAEDSLSCCGSRKALWKELLEVRLKNGENFGVIRVGNELNR